MKRNAPPYTIKMLKESISLDGEYGNNLRKWVDYWYDEALSQGHTKENAVDIASENLSNKICDDLKKIKK